MNGKRLINLKDDVVSGKCVLVSDSSGGIQRIIRVVALRIQGRDGRLFVQLGKKGNDASTISPDCCFPGGQSDVNETSEDSMDRLCFEKFRIPREALSLLHVTNSIEDHKSKTYDVPTRYYKDICFLVTKDPEDSMGSGVTDLHDMIDPLCRSSSSSLDSGLATFLSRETYVVKQNNAAYILCWVTEGEFDFLRSPPGEPGERLLSQWLSHLNTFMEEHWQGNGKLSWRSWLHSHG